MWVVTAELYSDSVQLLLFSSSSYRFVRKSLRRLTAKTAEYGEDFIRNQALLAGEPSQVRVVCCVIEPVPLPPPAKGATSLTGRTAVRVFSSGMLNIVYLSESFWVPADHFVFLREESISNGDGKAET